MRRMTLTVRMLGRPRIDVDGADAYRFRSQKSWGLLAYLLLSERAPARAQLAALLFDAADDPLRALRWSLAELRRGLGDGAVLEGDPLEVTLAPGTAVDVDVVARGTWREAIAVPDLGCELLESLNAQAGIAFDSWLATERRRVAAASEAALHEAALGLMAEGDLPAAISCATRAVAMSPLDENGQALVIRLHRNAGDLAGARDAYDTYRRLLREELGTQPGLAVESAWRDEPSTSRHVGSRASVEAILEAGASAVAAGATAVGMTSLRTAVDLADGAGDPDLRLRTRLVLGETLIHAVRGLDEEGLAALHEADVIAAEAGDRGAMAQIRTELGYVDFLRARYDRAERWLSDALSRSDGDAAVSAQARMYLGSVDSDRADYPGAIANLEEGAVLARQSGAVRREAYAAAMLGRVHLLRGDVERAQAALSSSIALSEGDRWLAFVPWPQSLLGEARLVSGDVDGAESHLEQAFARACQLGDPCWEGMSARSLALVSAARGNVEAAFVLLADAQARASRVADAYVWLDAYILDAMCELGVQHGHPDTDAWVASMRALADRTEMREMTVRALLHGAARGSREDAAGALLLSEGIDNPVLRHRAASA